MDEHQIVDILNEGNRDIDRNRFLKCAILSGIENFYSIV